ncbi:MAG: GNAT family N-acetyltransferase [Nitrospiraceae bacterium]
MDEVVHTERLIIVAGTPQSSRAAAHKDHQTLSDLLRATVPAAFPPPLMEDAMEYLAHAVEQNPQDRAWWNWFVVLKSVETGNTLIGCMGFKGKPTPDGSVEVGYSILDEFQGHGYATEGIMALIKWALQNGATSVAAETYPEDTASLRVMEKCGMKFVGPGSEPNTIRFQKS